MQLPNSLVVESAHLCQGGDGERGRDEGRGPGPLQVFTSLGARCCSGRAGWHAGRLPIDFCRAEMLELCLWSDWGAQVELGLGTFSSFEERGRMQAFYRVLATPSRKSSVLHDSDASRLFILHCFSQRSHTAVESCKLLIITIIF